MISRMSLAVLGGILIGLAISQSPISPVAHSQETKNEGETALEKDVSDLEAAAAAFEKAFNAGDAKAIGAQFLETAEAVDEEDNILVGRDKIEARFAELFKDYPKARITVELTSLRRVGRDVALEEGFSTTTLNPDEPGSRSPYTVVHLRRDGQWRIARVRDFPEEPPAETAHGQLQALAWLVGKWVDESQEGRVETTCEWSDDGNFLLQNYVVKTNRGELKGTQRIGWDGLRRTIRSWAFDRSGAFTEAMWTPIEGGWLLKVEGVTPDGQSASATRLVTPINDDSFQIDSTSVIIGNELLPDTSVRVVRQPPEPAS